MLRKLLQDTDGLAPETVTGLIIAFVVVGFCLLGLVSYAVFLTGRVAKLEARLFSVENHPKLQKGELDD